MSSPYGLSTAPLAHSRRLSPHCHTPAYVRVRSDGWNDASAASGASWESLPPGPDLARALAAIDPASLPDAQRVAYLACAHRPSGWVHIVESRAVVAVSDGWRIDTDILRDPHGPPDPTWISPLGRRYQTSPPRVLHNDFIPRRT